MNKKPIQRALIVGATSGIGKETALQLLQKGGYSDWQAGVKRT